ncbi:S-adenosyl-L-methionine-dependent methyltransferase [Bimuria novae-zelandiae CBS 107.79]|uniref:RNA methyltransferase n=1 Tax=Bimuria novae-zelandiae CBS 107.79 TaxID=1447943 RepID=A0A6A5V5J5_9PLEO|nr:S-adenosyl-L-methionine-dependent methyltransferase [Bimuria novae-zelandiae CBS 107.79]
MASKSTNYGNYQNYLGTNHAPGSPPAIHVRDLRLSVISSLGFSFKGCRCLDIGCNDGSVSTQIAFEFDASEVVGVDIDPKLVRKAEELYSLKASRVRPPSEPFERERLLDYYPMSAILRHGRLPASASVASHWPSVKFIAADWVVSTDPATTGPYDAILVLSVIKWIHLEHLDEGLVKFFHKCKTSLASGGYLILEVQGWESYQKAIRSNAAPHFAKNLASLQYRPETSFTKLLQDEGLHLCATSDQLRRPIAIYRKA